MGSGEFASGEFASAELLATGEERTGRIGQIQTEIRSDDVGGRLIGKRSLGDCGRRHCDKQGKCSAEGAKCLLNAKIA